MKASTTEPLFGDTAVAPSGTSTIPITGYSVLTGARIEYANGTPDIGFMSTSGADIEYKLTVGSSGTYKLNFSVASPQAGTFDLAVNGTRQAQYSFASTGGWQNYATTTQSVTLAAGTNTIKLSPTWASQFNINGITLTPVSVAPAASGTVTTIGSSTSVPVASYSAISNSQLEYQNGSPDIGYVSPSGSYVEYSVNVQSAGTYTVNVGTASPAWASMNLTANGTSVANFSLNATGSWSTFATSSETVTLPAGAVTLRFSSQAGTQYNLNAINLSLANGAAKAPTTVGSSAVSVPVDGYTAISNSQLESQNGAPDIGYVSTSGAYVEYTLNVQKAGTYTLTASTASPAWSLFAVGVNGTQAATYALNQTGSWSSFGNTSGSVYLPAGTVTLRFSSLYGTQYNLGGITIAPGSATTPVTTPTPPPATNAGGGFDASIGAQWMTSFNQLNIVAGSKNDSIYVTQSGNTIWVNVNGVSNSYTGPFGNIVVKAGSGADSITIDSSVTVDSLVYGGSGSDTLKNFTQGNATIVSVGGSKATVQGNGKNTAYWVDSSDAVNASGTEWNAGDVHTVSGFWGGVSTSLQGQNLSDPWGTGSTTRVANASLWGTGPTMGDVAQGQSSDCFLLGALQTLAYNNPSGLRQLAVDLGDGTYAVQFKRGGTTTYVRVDGDLPAGGPYANGLEYAHPGSSGNLWMPIFEKAYAEFRTSGWNYSSLNEGNFAAVFSDLGVGTTGFSAGNADSLYNTIAGALASGKGVTVGNNANVVWVAPLIYSHTYTVTAAWRDGSGNEYVQLRNPWGFDGAGNDSNPGDALVTMTIGQLNANLQAGTIT